MTSSQAFDNSFTTLSLEISPDLSYPTLEFKYGGNSTLLLSLLSLISVDSTSLPIQSYLVSTPPITHIGGDAALSLVAVAASLCVRGPAHVQVVEDGVRSDLVRSHHQLERVGLRRAGASDESAGQDRVRRDRLNPTNDQPESPLT